MGSRFRQQKVINHENLEVAGLAGDGSHSSVWVPCEGYKRAKIYIYFIASGDAVSGNLTFNVEHKVDDVPVTFMESTETVSGGTATLVKKVFTFDTGNATGGTSADVELTGNQFRLTNIAVASGHANDKIYAAFVLMT